MRRTLAITAVLATGSLLSATLGTVTARAEGASAVDAPIVDTTIAVTPAGDTPAIDAESVLGAIANAYGGRESLATFPGFHARGKVLSLADGVNGELRLDLSLEGELRSEILYPDRMETRILSGPLAWKGGQHHQAVADREMNAAMRLQYHRLAAPFELAIADPADFVVEERSTEGFLRLRRDWTSLSSTLYEIDPETFRIRRTRGEIRSDENVIRFETESHDFREIDGILFPFRMTTTIGGHAAAEIILDRLAREDDFDPQLFLPSGGGGDM